ncbi:DEAD-box ATP-dependent RNA helicase 39-like isoform X2 [Prosopis cineraria]|uniref:DEAD-box ATP-dependent RNA helicase 39-like isoform X2 n=1 Tax=Prosopis cineraria TaxID=364024 RepID=UPI00240FF8C5|nr:DEAD-box ATP-dependent RNA helicase 39-like isoform X2 [Prosopis cineraria]
MRRSRELLRLYISLRDLITKSPSSSTRSFPGLVIPFSSSFSSTLNGEDDKRSPKSQRDLLLLEKFRLRKLKGSSTTSEKIMEKNLKDEDERTEVVTNFKKLGLCEKLIEVLEKLGVLVPSEIQCAGIPAVLEGKSVLMSSLSGHDRTLAYLLPLIQLLRQDRKLSHSNLKHPRAVVLCATEENAEQCFNAAKYIIRHAEFKSTKNDASLNNEQSDVSIGLVIGSPSEILQYIEEGTVIPEEIRYLVIDDADIMFDSDLGGEIHKIIRQLPDYTSNFATGGLQTVLVTSTLTEVWCCML